MPAECVIRAYNCIDKEQMLVEGVSGPTKATWSRDSKWLAFDGDFQDQGRGVWLLQVSGREVFQIAAGNYRGPTWSPDGQNIMVVVGSPLAGQPDPTLVSYTSLALLDVSEIVNSSVASP
jgi:Tol biopolymer transport system component